ncbi:UBX domain-containing protein 6-like [Patiria miniata]|uniref:UBX domain-containing protein n=1 Tax=Patiria miniata TaxID=46514 RepID=A0A914BTB3_PATMI|nr:UBX domain-containing protein 6-like [Patiria miniata]
MEIDGGPSLNMKDPVSANLKAGRLGDALSGSTPSERVAKEDSSAMSVPCIFFQCPFGCSAIYPKSAIDEHMLGHLKRMLQYRPLEASVLMIHSLSKNKGRLHTGLQILCKYLDNVCNNPTEEKYRNISEHNKAFQEKVAPIEGARDFLQAVGFQPKKLSYKDTNMPFLVMSEECASDIDQIKSARDVLLNTQPTEAEIHRDIRVYYPSHKAEEFHVPKDFYDVTSGLQVHDPRKSRRYKYTLIRIRFPDGVLLQGTFQVEEKLSAVKAFISSMLEKEWQPFVLRDKNGKAMSAVNSTLHQLKLVPGAILDFGFNATIEAEMATGLYFCIHGPVQQEHHLKSVLMRTIKVL